MTIISDADCGFDTAIDKSSSRRISTRRDLASVRLSSASSMTLCRARLLPEGPMPEGPSDDMIDERIDAWQRGAFGPEATIYDALGWSRDEYMVWLSNPGAAPDRPLPPLPVTRSWLARQFG
jgi:hypothetical protein